MYVYLEGRCGRKVIRFGRRSCEGSPPPLQQEILRSSSCGGLSGELEENYVELFAEMAVFLCYGNWNPAWVWSYGVVQLMPNLCRQVHPCEVGIGVGNSVGATGGCAHSSCYVDIPTRPFLPLLCYPASILFCWCKWPLFILPARIFLFTGLNHL